MSSGWGYRQARRQVVAQAKVRSLIETMQNLLEIDHSSAEAATSTAAAADADAADAADAAAAVLEGAELSLPPSSPCCHLIDMFRDDGILEAVLECGGLSVQDVSCIGVAVCKS